MSIPDKASRVFPHDGVTKLLATAHGEVSVKILRCRSHETKGFEYYGLPAALLEIGVMRPEWVAPRRWKDGWKGSRKRFDEFGNGLHIQRGRAKWRIMRRANSAEACMALPGFEPWMLEAELEAEIEQPPEMREPKAFAEAAKSLEGLLHCVSTRAKWCEQLPVETRAHIIGIVDRAKAEIAASIKPLLQPPVQRGHLRLVVDNARPAPY